MRLVSRVGTLCLLLALVAGAGIAAPKKITTDGTNRKSPIKVTKLNFYDSGYGRPGPSVEIRTSATIQNTGQKALTGVVMHLQLKTMDGQVVKQWVKQIGVMQPGSSVTFQPNSIYYNQTYNNLKAGVLVEHNPVKGGQ